MEPAYAAPLSLVGVPHDPGILWLLMGLPTGESIKLRSRPASQVKTAVDRWGQAIEAFTDAMDPEREFSARYKAEKLAALEQSCRDLTEAFFGDDEPILRGLIGAGKVRRIDVAVLAESQHLPLDFCLVGQGLDQCYLGEAMMAVYRRAGTSGPRTSRMFMERRPSAPRIGYAEDDGLASACLNPAAPATIGREHIEEINALHPLVESLDDVVILGELGGMSAFDRERLRDWLSMGHTVLHFNAHSPAARSADGPSMRLRRKTMIDRAEIRASSERESFRFTGCLVFLNICQSGLGGSTYEGSIASEFAGQHADAVICTIGPVIDALATRFATLVYAGLARAGNTLQDAFLEARTCLMGEVGHPLPLLYTYVGRDDLTVPSWHADAPTSSYDGGR